MIKHQIESNRIEFKAGWNPDEIYHTVCVFANDFENVGGGYIVIGVEEKNGVAVRPVKGIEESELDKMQKEILGYNNVLVPAYFPKVIVEKVDGKYVMVLWVLAGDNRPYIVPEHITVKREKKYFYYIRYATSSVKANAEQEQELIVMSRELPFDSRPNQRGLQSFLMAV